MAGTSLPASASERANAPISSPSFRTEAGFLIFLVQEMSEEDKKELDEMLAQNKEWEEIYAFLEKKFENLDDIVKEEVQKFQNELAESAKDLGFTQRE